VSQTEGPWNGKAFTEFLQLQGRIPVAEYVAFAKNFRPDAFDAEAIARTARDMGMRYLFLTSKHQRYDFVSCSFSLQLAVFTDLKTAPSSFDIVMR
jgi:hypothetical protein